MGFCGTHAVHMAWSHRAGLDGHGLCTCVAWAGYCVQSSDVNSRPGSGVVLLVKGLSCHVHSDGRGLGSHRVDHIQIFCIIWGAKVLGDFRVFVLTEILLVEQCLWRYPFHLLLSFAQIQILTFLNQPTALCQSLFNILSVTYFQYTFCSSSSI